MKRFFRRKEKAFFGKFFLIFGMLAFLFGASTTLTGNFIGANGFFDGNISFTIIGIVFLFVSFLILVSKENVLEMIVVPTGPSGEIEKQRAEGGARLYHARPNSRVIISGYLNGITPGTFRGSQSHQIYKTLRRNGVPRGDIDIEGKSHDTLENVRYVSKILKDENIPHATVVTDRDHARRMSMLFRKAKEEGIAPKDLEIETYSKGIEKAYGPLKAEFSYLKDSARRVKDGKISAL